MNGYLVVASAGVGFLVGLTGAGGGALMTPMLVMLFSVKPAVAISSDLVAAVVMRPVGAAVHLKRGSVHLALAGWITVGAAPAAFAGSYVLHAMVRRPSATRYPELALGLALLLGCAAIAARAVLDRRGGTVRDGSLGAVVVRPLASVGIGVVGGFVVGLTSVGAGSLIVVLLMFVYPSLPAGRLVGTDLAQAIPLTGAAALGALAFGSVSVPLTASVVVGSVPAVLAGAVLSSRVKDRWLRPVIFGVTLLSGLKYVGVGDRGLVSAALVLAVALAATAGMARTRGGDRRSLRGGPVRDPAGGLAAAHRSGMP